MLYILDTDHISLLQHRDLHLIAHLKRVPLPLRAVTVISLAEQVQGRLAVISKAKGEVEAGVLFNAFMKPINFIEQFMCYPMMNRQPKCLSSYVFRRCALALKIYGLQQLP